MLLTVEPTLIGTTVLSSIGFASWAYLFGWRRGFRQAGPKLRNIIRTKNERIEELNGDRIAMASRNGTWGEPGTGNTPEPGSFAEQ